MLFSPTLANWCGLSLDSVFVRIISGCCRLNSNANLGGISEGALIISRPNRLRLVMFELPKISTKFIYYKGEEAENAACRAVRG